MKNRARLYKFSDGSGFRGKAADEVFNEIHDRKAWNVETFESVSGEGSSLAQTAVLIEELPPVLEKLGVKSILDIPCGDFHWMQHVPVPPDVHYTGADIVASLVENNRSKYAGEHRQFILANLLKDDLPHAGLIFCRDCLVHFSFRDIELALQNIRRSKARYLAITHFSEEPENKDIVTGGWRPLNFCRAPFHFPEPQILINEKCTERGGAFRDKSLAIWVITPHPPHGGRGVITWLPTLWWLVNTGNRKPVALTSQSPPAPGRSSGR
jgi:hypothetical protein